MKRTKTLLVLTITAAATYLFFDIRMPDGFIKTGQCPKFTLIRKLNHNKGLLNTVYDLGCKHKTQQNSVSFIKFNFSIILFYIHI